MRGTERLYGALVNRVPGIREHYQKKRAHAAGIRRGGVWLYLLGLNVSYYVFHNRKLEQMEHFPYYEKKTLYSEGSESSLSYREPPELFAERLAEHDVVSFDVFDTLILRPFSEPADLFFFSGEELRYPDWKRIRQEMEQEAREKKYKAEGHREVTISEIYDLLERETGVEKSSAMAMEAELEKRFCFANPYMKLVTDRLRERNRRLIITSDMYLDAGQIRELLQCCGYGEFDAYYVSCEYGRSKSKGDLYDLVRIEEAQTECKIAEMRNTEAQGNKKEEAHVIRIAHVGDNEISDVRHAKEHGVTPFYYRNVNAAGALCRPEDMSSITGSLYRGTVNAHIHNGLNCFSREYEYGFIYGGLFVTGYCQFIHQYVKSHKIDKILFLARDGDVLSKAYHILYPEEDKNREYVYWSRLAGTKMAAGKFKYDYFRRFLFHKVNQGYKMEQILNSMELADMLEDLCEQTGLTKETVLTDRNVGTVKTFLMERWAEVSAHYQEQLDAGRLYYAPILDGCRHAAAVDIGWAGSGAITLDYIVNEVWQMDCGITGIIAGTNTCHNAEPDYSETFLQSGKLVSYLYSQRENRDLWKFHDPGKDHNLFWEMLLDAPSGSLKGFYLREDGGWECRFKDADEAKKDKIEEIQRGILRFVECWRFIQKKESVQCDSEKQNFYTEIRDLCGISGRDAYQSMLLMMGDKNMGFRKGLQALADEITI
ncbi:MAG: hypothetical protein LIO96_14445 [Lachnospiraceae bacterium]|nr:hypothetical protein [Lachnospiraceae bacterium]